MSRRQTVNVEQFSTGGFLVTGTIPVNGGQRMLLSDLEREKEIDYDYVEYVCATEVEMLEKVKSLLGVKGTLEKA